MANPLPQEIPALKFTPGRPEPTLVSLQVQSGEALKALRAQFSPAAFVIAADNLERLAFLKEHAHLQRPKHNARSLTDHLLNTGSPDDRRVPLIQGGHRSGSQLKRSIRTFLRHALSRNATQIYFVGAAPHLFEQLRSNRIASRDRRLPARRESTLQASAWGEPISEREVARRLLEQLPEVEIPAQLTAFYAGHSVEVQAVRRLIMVAAGCALPVVILGESGTGKELVARAVHQYGGRPGLFEPINCSTFPPDLLESELFGYVEGAFTQARKAKKGLWETAQDGTLFLDEIADLRLEHQAKLLRVLEEGKIRRLGDTQAIPVNARIICASNRDLYGMVRAGRFREDLYYRIRGLMIRTPSLRSHLNDIEDLAQLIWTRITGDARSVLPRPILSDLRRHSWPGNVRELKSVLLAMHNLFGKTGLTGEKLQLAAAYLGADVSVATAVTAGGRELPYRSECLRHLLRADEVVQACRASVVELEKLGNAADETARRTAHTAFQHRLSELELLTLRPLLFHGRETYAAVDKFKYAFHAFSRQLESQPAPALQFWRTEGEAALKKVVSALFAEVQRVLK
jgi:DNA-binding NtrC family response regulator